MNKYIIESIEGRITLGITMFVAIMILTGWIAINEPARMAEFVEQHEGRSIERGAELFAANCSTCHGINGYGIGNRAPGLNNPQLFGIDFLGDLNGQIARHQRQFVEINGVEGLNVSPYSIPDTAGTLAVLEARQEGLQTQFGASEDGSEEQRALLIELLNVEAQLSEDLEDVAARIAAIKADAPIGVDANSELELSGNVSEPEEEGGEVTVTGELGDRLEALESNIPTTLAEIDAALNGEDGLLAQRNAMIDEMSGPILRGYWPRLDTVLAEAVDAEAGGYVLWLTDYLINDANRLSQLAFGGSLDSYITTTLIHGRPGSNTVWPAPMDSWSQRGGGPLRDDQIGDLVSYMNNWNKGDNWAIEDLFAVEQFGRIHAAYTGETGDEAETVGPTPDAATLPTGDATRGELLYNSGEAPAVGGVLGCAGCHNGTVAPELAGTGTRATQRLAEEQFANYTAEQYLAESIAAPGAYVVTGFTDGLMSREFGNVLDAQDLADIIAFLMTQE